MSRVGARLFAAFVVFGTIGAMVRADVPVSVANYSTRPVYATAVALDANELCAKLGVAEGTPLRVQIGTTGTEAPISREMEDGRPVIFAYVSLPPASRLDLRVQKADRWPEPTIAQAKCEKIKSSKPADAGEVVSGEMRNGILRFTIGARGWELGFESPMVEAKAKPESTSLIKDGGLDFWIDNQSRGRIMNADPRDLGLVQFAKSRLESCESSITPEGRPMITIVRRLDGFAKEMTVTQTFELVPGKPLLITRIHWQNDSGAPLWVAYVKSGDGVKGNWAKGLMAGPLVERKKSAILGDLNGGETRPAWIGQLCRISMESLSTGCGVGMSTLLPTPGKVGQGSMIWGCGSSGFQCNFIDPVQGQFPHMVKAHDGLDNGFAFLAAQTGSSVFRQTVELWTTLQKGNLLRAMPACAVFVDGKAQHPQTVFEMADAPSILKLLQPVGTTRQMALRADLNKYYECQVAVQSASAREPVQLTAVPMKRGKTPVSLLKADKPGDYRIDLNKTIGGTDEMDFVLELSAPLDSVKGLGIAEVLPVSPEAISPLADASFTDIATMFRWKAIPMVVEYDLQWSRSADFASPVQVRVAQSDPFPWYFPPDDKLPAPGKWFWRVRGIKGSILGVWSQTRAFVVNDDHSTKPVKRPINARTPLFTIEASKTTDLANFNPDIPADLAPYVGIIAEGYVSKGLTIDQFMSPAKKLPYAIMIRSHHPTWVALPDLEWVCQNVPNFVGIQGGETLSCLYGGKDDAMVYHQRMTRICAKYGVIYQEADGTYKDDKWQDLFDKQGPFVRKYGPWLVLTQKNNIIRRQFYSQSAAMGLWLGGITHQHGAWEDGGFYWQNAGFGELGTCTGERTGVLKTMPRIFWDLVFVMGISRGCGMYSLDGQTLMFSPKEAERFPKDLPRAVIWDTTGTTTDTFKRFVAPLIRGVVQHNLIPTKDQVLGNVKIAVFNDRPQGEFKAWPHYAEYGPLYAGTYGFRKMGNIDGQLWEFFPNTGRYYYIPVLVQGNEPLGGGIRNIGVSQLQDVAKVKEIFNAAYPDRYTGDALACQIGTTITIQNSRENEDVTEAFGLKVDADLVHGLVGKIAPHAYLVAKVEDQGKRFWLQTNGEYPDREMEVQITCSRKPEVKIEPAAAGKEIVWDDAAKCLKLRLSYREGAAEVMLTPR